MYMLTAYKPGPHFIFMTGKSDDIRDRFDSLGPEWIVAELQQLGLGIISRHTEFIDTLISDIRVGCVTTLDHTVTPIHQVIPQHWINSRLVASAYRWMGSRSDKGPVFEGQIYDCALIFNRPSACNLQAYERLGNYPFSMFTIIPEETLATFGMYRAMDYAGVLIQGGCVVDQFDYFATLDGFDQILGPQAGEVWQRCDAWSRSLDLAKGVSA